ncbi:MAG TPA: 3'(2'),5'-bisphosphate nucleotidase CysQ [Polyangiaceae bacterium]|nr:MAG: 3'(2'),5'-bisphosphate nucleotidase CysQ [Deltaproteobacteria bacterium ADurb.Bin207]HNS97461.1 3'(2'),5'-bisphosphate nucleotidase CysQ [Polyangiaceae bacterium]HNZ21668.1 3'(2'),5'-bisphosphate nucleotidase CysQ [Polyangiaceae bacterium]HOD24183.1 3'(2'),5'-bisphosphate nucleotidase CysQ [Polyangiaceae bacterium]HOE48625.1 3'(2'),5'-bisphosphate nucleotidase CysQ [Polyangiaceae bacterium]
MNQHFTQELQVTIAAAQQASQIILSVYEQDFEVERKAGNEPVTQADRQANTLLVQRLSEAFPSDGIVAEESVPSPQDLAEQVARERVWFVDPLDGTKEFIARNGEFSTMIGLTVRGRPVLGVVAQPAFGIIAVGVVGQGAWLLEPDGTKTPLRVSEHKRVNACTVIVSRSHLSAPLQKIVKALAPAARISCGSVGVKATRIAQRQADVYVNPHQPGGAKLWDGCAPDAIVVAAGGKTSDLSGRDLDYSTTTLELVGGFVATNGHLHDEVLATARRVWEEG